jgi:hypothetical protein
MKRTVTLLAVATLLAACGAKEEAPATDSATMASAPTITMESLAGDFSWVLKAEPGDSVISEGMSHQNPDGSGWTLATNPPGDTVRYTSAMVGDSLITTSMPYKGTGALAAAGDIVFRGGGVPTGAATRIAAITISPAAKPDTVIFRGRAELTKK